MDDIIIYSFIYTKKQGFLALLFLSTQELFSDFCEVFKSTNKL